jgi:hypothetical protein
MRSKRVTQKQLVLDEGRKADTDITPAQLVQKVLDVVPKSVVLVRCLRVVYVISIHLSGKRAFVFIGRIREVIYPNVASRAEGVFCWN